MPRDTYQDDLDALREAVFALGQRVAERVRTALTAFDTGDVAEATGLVESDHEINDRYRELESDCIDLFALQQPVAKDLRLVAASYKILTDIERVGDLAAKLGKYTRGGTTHSVPAEVSLYQLGIQAIEQFERALVAYRDGAVEDCYAVAEADDDLDELCDRTGRLVIRDMIYEDVGTEPAPERVEALLDETSRLLLVVRDLERVGDHAVNIAARTVYMTEADGDLVY
jgi:phosphate transport system protein